MHTEAIIVAAISFATSVIGAVLGYLFAMRLKAVDSEDRSLDREATAQSKFLDQVLSEVDALRKELSDVQERLQAMQERFVKLSAEKAKAEIRADELEGENKKIIAELSQERQKVSALETRLEQLGSELVKYRNHFRGKCRSCLENAARELNFPAFVPTPGQEASEEI